MYHRSGGRPDLTGVNVELNNTEMIISPFINRLQSVNAFSWLTHHLYLLRSLLATSLDFIVNQETGRLAAVCGIVLAVVAAVILPYQTRYLKHRN